MNKCVKVSFVNEKWIWVQFIILGEKGEKCTFFVSLNSYLTSQLKHLFLKEGNCQFRSLKVYFTIKLMTNIID